MEEQDQGESEDDMERLISLFREPASDGGYVSPSEPPRPAMQADLADLKVLDDQPIYFRQLLEYLRQQKQQKKRKQKDKRSDHEDESDGAGSGAGNGASGAD